jgi:hypothetical protein
MNMNTWNGTTLRQVFNEGANDYHAAMMRVAAALAVPFVDLEQKTAQLFQSVGPSYLANFIFHAGEGTHFVEMGALMNARFIAEGIKELATNADVGQLAAVLAPQYMMIVKSNKTGAGVITLGGTYPEGAPITLLAIPNSGETFQQWQDAVEKSLTTQTQYQFTMGAAACAYGAIFKGGSTAVSREAPSAVRSIPSIAVSENGMISIMSNNKILSARVTDLLGKNILYYEPNSNHAVLDVGSFSHGIYFVSARTGAGSVTQLIRR